MTRILLPRRAVLLGAIPAACGIAATTPRTVTNLAELRDLPITTADQGIEVIMSDAVAGGRFRWDGNSSLEPDGGIIVRSRTAERGRWVRVYSGAVSAAWFGASPRASAEQNSRAFASASAAINRADGGTLMVPPGAYRVGYQKRPTGRLAAVAAGDIIKIEACSRPVVISGSGVTLKAADGLKFGAFNPLTGARHQTKLPFYDTAFRSDAYSMIEVLGCTAPVRIEGFELDGNLQNYELGGEWGDTGRQVTAVGIMLMNNTGGVAIAGIKAHDHGLDGIMVVHYNLTEESPLYPVTLSDVVCDRNGRQGLSWVGGTQLTALRCRFTRTGKGGIYSAPGAGVDIESEDSVCRNGRFIDCEFSDNAGVGFLTPSGKVANILLDRCKFVGTTNWSTWTQNPGIVFKNCLFVGSIVNAFPSSDRALATQFIACRFDDDPSLTPTGKSFGEFLADLGGGSTNVLFSDCDFQARTPGKALPWTPADTRYHNCRFRQASHKVSYPRGVFTGTCRFESAGQVDLYGSRLLGRVTLNGKPLH